MINNIENNNNNIFDNRINKEKIEQINKFNISNESIENSLNLRKNKIIKNIYKNRILKLKNNKFYSNKKNNEYEINYENLIKNISLNIQNEFNEENEKKLNEIFLKYLNINEKNENNSNFFIQTFTLIKLLNYIEKNENFFDLNLLNLCIKIYCEDLNNEIKIKLHYLLLSIFYNWTLNIKNIENYQKILFYDEIFLKYLNFNLNSEIYNNIEFKINVILLLDNLIYDQKTFEIINKNIQIENFISNLLPLIEKIEDFILIFKIIKNLFEFFIKSEENKMDENEEEFYNDNINNKKEENKIFLENIYENSLILFNNYYERYKKNYLNINEKINIYKLLKIMIKFYQISLYFSNLKMNKYLFYIIIFMNNEKILFNLTDILEYFYKNYFINNNNSIQITNNIKIENKNLFNNIKIFNSITYIFSLIFYRTENNETEQNKLYEIFNKILNNYKIIDIYSGILSQSLVFQKYFNSECLYNLCLLIRNICCFNYDYSKKILMFSSILKYLINYTNICKDYNFLNELLIIFENLLDLNNIEIMNYLLNEYKILNFYCDLLINKKENNEIVKHILNFIYILIDNYSMRLKYSNKRYILEQLEKKNTIEIIKNLCYSKNKEISDLSFQILDNYEIDDILEIKNDINEEDEEEEKISDNNDFI